MSRLSISGGWKRIASATGLVELLKASLSWFPCKHKRSLVSGCAASTMLQSLDLPFQSFAGTYTSASLSILVPVAIGVTLMASGDLLFSRFSWGQQRLRMTRQEVKDEMKQAEGDQQMVYRRRAIGRSRIPPDDDWQRAARHTSGRQSDAFAVALRYVRSETGRRWLLCKGTDLIALQIRRIAEKNDIPVVEDRALARSLFAAVEIDQPIPKEFYSAIANIILLLRKVGNRHVIKALES